MELILNYSNFDMYSKKLGFFFKNQDKIGSFFGLFLSLLYVIVSLVLFITQIVGALKREELNVYDSTIYAQEMPSIEVDKKLLYFAFGLEEPLTSNRFMDESIYIPKVAFVEKVKINDELTTVNTTNLPLERCNVNNFGEDYKHLFTKNELNNSYCLKNFDYTLNFAGGYKYEKFNYLRLRIYPCVNSSSNNNSCRPQEIIDEYLASGYFSILIKDFGLNPSNYSQPVVPTFQDLYTTIDKKIYRNYILNFGITEIQTDNGLFNDNLEKIRYFQYRKEIQTFTFRDEQEYYNGKSIILVQFKLDDAVIIQKRSYTKIAEIFSRIGGYMQLMNTVFLLIASMVNKLHFDLKIINSIFKFNIKENKILLRLNTFKELTQKINANVNSDAKKNSIFVIKNQVEEKKSMESENKSKNNLITKEKDFNISDLNLSNNNISLGKKNSSNKLGKYNSFNPLENQSINLYSLKSKMDNKSRTNIHLINKFNFDMKNKTKEKLSIKDKDIGEDIHLNFFDYFCVSKKSKRYKYVLLFNKGNRFFRKKIDIIHVFSLLTFFEEYLKKELIE
mgnify:FL=1